MVTLSFTLYAPFKYGKRQWSLRVNQTWGYFFETVKCLSAVLGEKRPI